MGYAGSESFSHKDETWAEEGRVATFLGCCLRISLRRCVLLVPSVWGHQEN
jgi:hypothetical protein